jgi:L-ribulokinase
LIATGGLPDRNKLLMQIYSDGTGLPIYVPEATQIGALGSAMHGAVAAGSMVGGYDSIVDASVNMARLREDSYQPIPENKAIYDKLFAEYVTLHDYFGRGANNVMKRLKAIKVEARKA